MFGSECRYSRSRRSALTLVSRQVPSCKASRPIEGCVALFRTQHNLTNERSIIAVRKRDAADGLAAGKLWHGLCILVRLIGQLYPYPLKARASSRPMGLSRSMRGAKCRLDYALDCGQCATRSTRASVIEPLVLGQAVASVTQQTHTSVRPLCYCSDGPNSEVRRIVLPRVHRVEHCQSRRARRSFRRPE